MPKYMRRLPAIWLAWPDCSPFTQPPP